MNWLADQYTNYWRQSKPNNNLVILSVTLLVPHTQIGGPAASLEFYFLVGQGDISNPSKTPGGKFKSG